MRFFSCEDILRYIISHEYFLVLINVQDFFCFLLDPSSYASGSRDGLYDDANVSWGLLYSPFDLGYRNYFYNGTEGTYNITVNINTMKISLE